MTGIIIFALLSTWLVAAYKISKKITKWINNENIRLAVNLFLSIAIFILPILDEIIGSIQFEHLCETGGIYEISPADEKNKFSLSYISGDYKEINSIARPALSKTISYIDTNTKKPVAVAEAYFARGGWLVQTAGFSTASRNGPLIGRNQCFPGDIPEQAKRIHKITKNLVES